VGNLEAWLESHEEKQNSSLEKIEKRLKEIDDKLNGRPTWPVAIIITVLSSACVGLLVHAIKF